MPPLIRTATADDAIAMASIYGRAVHESVATFDVVDPPAGYWQDKIGSGERGDRVYIAAESGSTASDVVGFAYSTAFRPRPAYAATRETSIYLAPHATGRGIGTLLYRRLLDTLRADDVHCAVAVIAQPNPASVALHRAFGYQLVGTLREVGRKFDRWVDTAWYQLLL